MTGLVSGRQVVAAAGTRVQLVNAAIVSTVRSVLVQALSANTGVIVVGDSQVVAAAATRRGVALTAGQSVTVDVDDLSDVWIDATVAGEGVTYLAEVA